VRDDEHVERKKDADDHLEKQAERGIRLTSPGEWTCRVGHANSGGRRCRTCGRERDAGG
jgi:hypothetical protein